MNKESSIDGTLKKEDFEREKLNGKSLLWFQHIADEAIVVLDKWQQQPNKATVIRVL